MTFVYLATSESTEWVTASITTTGTTTNTGITGFRAHTMRFDTGTDTTFNIGLITLRHRTTTANVFLTILEGRSQSNYAVYRVPAGSTGYIKRIHGSIRRSTSATVDGALWVRTNGGSPRFRRPFTIGQTSRLIDDIYPGAAIEEKSDITLRILASTASNVEVTAGFDIVIIKN